MPKNIVKRKTEGGLTERQHEFLKALNSTVGVITAAARIAGIHVQTHYDWLKNSPAYREVYNQQIEHALDFAETQLFKQMKNGNSASTIFYLKSKGKHRGYGDDDTQIQGKVTITIGPPSDDAEIIEE